MWPPRIDQQDTLSFAATPGLPTWERKQRIPITLTSLSKRVCESRNVSNLKLTFIVAWQSPFLDPDQAPNQFAKGGFWGGNIWQNVDYGAMARLDETRTCVRCQPLCDDPLTEAVTVTFLGAITFCKSLTGLGRHPSAFVDLKKTIAPGTSIGAVEGLTHTFLHEIFHLLAPWDGSWRWLGCKFVEQISFKILFEPPANH